jgi:hypothetical protein
MGRKGTGREGWGERGLGGRERGGRGKRVKRVERGWVGLIPAADMHVAYRENTYQ